MARKTYVASSPGFIVDHSSITRNDGRQIDWDEVDAAFVDADTGKKKLPAGTPVGETSAGGKVAERTAARAAIGLLATDAVQGDRVAALSGYGIIKGGVIYQNLLPGGEPAQAVKDELNAAGTGFSWETHADDTAS